MNRKNLETVALRARDKARSLRNKIAGASAVVVGSLYTGLAMASGTSVGGTAAAAISGAESDVELVQTAMLGVLILLVVFGLIKKSFGK